MKCTLSLPHFYYNAKFNDCFKTFTLQFPDSKQYDFNIESYYGSFPFVSWNGDINSNYLNNKPLPVHDDFLLILKNLKSVLRMDMTNYYIQDYNDVHSNIILKMCENGSTQIEFSNYQLYESINEKFPNFKYVYNNKYNSEYKKCDNIIFLHDFYKNTLNANTEVLVGEKCSCDMVSRKKCLLQENVNQITFSGKSIYTGCEKINKYNTLNLRKEIDFYLSKGVRYFKIDSPNIKDLNQFNQYLIKNLLKEEYQNRFWNYYNKE